MFCNVMNILAIIPARGGSKDVPRKNILPIAGKPLIAWTIEAAKNSRFVTRTIVSSDDDEILAVAKHHGAETLVRPKELAHDKAQSESVIAHVLDVLKEREQYEPDLFLYLQPTSPLRTHYHVDRALEELKQSNADSLIAVRKTDNLALKCFLVKDGKHLQGIAGNTYPFMNRQELPPTYAHNGALYIMSPSTFRKHGQLISKQTIPFIMGEEESLEIDTMDDVPRIEQLIRKRNN